MVDVLGATGARELVRATVEADPWDLLENDLAEAGKRKAKAEAVENQLDHMRKVVLSRIQTELASVHKNTSEAKLARLARADPRYEDHLKGWSAAKEEKELAHADYWRIRSELTWMERTIAHANKMADLK